VGLEDDDGQMDELVEEEDEEEEEKAGVPVTICIVTIFLYMLAGANMYQYVEHWDLLSCLYHAYVTMATIGLGDYFPGKNADIRETGIRIYHSGSHRCLHDNRDGHHLHVLHSHFRRGCWQVQVLG